MKRLFQSRTLCVLRHGPLWFALLPNQSVLPASSVARFVTFSRSIYVPDALCDGLCSVVQFRSISMPTPPTIQFP